MYTKVGSFAKLRPHDCPVFEGSRSRYDFFPEMDDVAKVRYMHAWMSDEQDYSPSEEMHDLHRPSTYCVNMSAVSCDHSRRESCELLDRAHYQRVKVKVLL